MRKAHRGLGLSAALTLAAGGLLAMVAPTAASAAPSQCTVATSQVNNTARAKGIGGIVVAAGTSSTCQDPPRAAGPGFNGTPPLLFNGRPPVCSLPSPCDFGDVMSTRSTGETTSGANGQACTINNEGPAPVGTTAYCAYHGTDQNDAVYSNMAYPIYDSATGSRAAPTSISAWSSRRTATRTPTSRSAQPRNQRGDYRRLIR
jgi:hypothetical protein